MTHINQTHSRARILNNLVIMFHDDAEAWSIARLFNEIRDRMGLDFTAQFLSIEAYNGITIQASHMDSETAESLMIVLSDIDEPGVAYMAMSTVIGDEDGCTYIKQEDGSWYCGATDDTWEAEE